MELTTEDKARIYNEEKAKLVEQERQTPPAPSPKSYPAVALLCWVHYLVGSLFAIVGLYLVMLHGMAALSGPSGDYGHVLGTALGGGLFTAALLQFAAGQLLRIFMDQASYQRNIQALLEKLSASR